MNCRKGCSQRSFLQCPSIRVFSDESALRIRWPKYWSFSFNISPTNEHPGLISFRMDWLDLLEVQGTLKSLLQHHSSKASILRCPAFFIVQLSHPYTTTGKTISWGSISSWGFTPLAWFSAKFRGDRSLPTSWTAAAALAKRALAPMLWAPFSAKSAVIWQW